MANCNLLWDIFDGDISDQLMIFFVVYCCFICFFGILCNVLVLWCIAGCPKTRPSMKVLLFGLFTSTMLMCLLVMPFMAHVGFAKLYCDRRIPNMLLRIMIALYIILTEMELLYITLLALLRTVAVWSSQRRPLKMTAAVTLLVTTSIYCVGATMLVLAPVWVHVMDTDTVLLLTLVYDAVHVLLPVVVTLVCYLSMMFIVWRNKRRLACSHHEATAKGQKVMDQATRAMLAVFVSNLLFVLPHSIYHILTREYHVISYVIVHCVFYTHLFVDPLAYLYCNVHHRRRVLHTLASWTQWANCGHATPPPHAASIRPLQAVIDDGDPHADV